MTRETRQTRERQPRLSLTVRCGRGLVGAELVVIEDMGHESLGVPAALYEQVSRGLQLQSLWRIPAAAVS